MKRKIFFMGMLGCILAAVQVQAEVSEDASAISIIGGADGPTSIFFAGKLSNESSKDQEEVIEEIYALKTEYVGDASAVGSLVMRLTEEEYLPLTKNTSFEILSDEEPYGLIIRLGEETKDREETEQKLTEGGTILLALIDNLSEIQFTYPFHEASDGEEKEYTVNWDLKAAEEYLGQNVKDYGESQEAFQELIAKIQSEESR